MRSRSLSSGDFAPRLEALGADAEVEVPCELARFEAGLGREGIADVIWDVGRRQYVHGSLDEHEIAGRADADADLAGGRPGEPWASR
jgi:hypothetical protein